MGKVTENYRTEAGKYCIEIRLQKWQQLFDSRDPAPFRERDLDDDAVDYISAAVLELGVAPAKLVIYLPLQQQDGFDPKSFAGAIHRFFAFEEESWRKRHRETLREGYVTTLIGAVFLTVVMLAVSFIQVQFHSTIATILSEGLLILGWVAMWRPLDLLLYSWWPYRKKLRMFRSLATIEIEWITDSN